MREKDIYETSKIIVYITHFEQASIQNLLWEDKGKTFSPVLLEKQKNKLLRLIMGKEKVSETPGVSQKNWRHFWTTKSREHDITSVLSLF